MATPYSMAPQRMNRPLPGGLDAANSAYKPPIAIPGHKSPIPGMPDSPGYGQVYNPNTMAMGPAFDAKQAEVNKLGFNQFKDAALRQGPSAWATLANKQTQDQTNVARDQARASGAGVAAQTEAGLASSGGLSGGARERAQEGGAKSIMSMDQNLQRQGLQNASQIATNDEQQKMQMMSQLPGMAQQQLGAWQGVQQQDLANMIGEGNNQNQYNKDIYGIDSTSAAANATANAQQAAAEAQANAPSLGNGFGVFKKQASDTDKILYASGIGIPLGAIGQYTGAW